MTISRMRYEDSDVRETRENAAASRAMSQEAAELLAQGATSYRAGGLTDTSFGATSLPELEIGSEVPDSGQVGSQSETPVSHSSTDSTQALASTTGDDRSQRLETRQLENVPVGSPSISDALANVSAEQVQDGLNLGVMRGFQPTASIPYGQGVANLYNWLDGQIPRDGTTVTEDRRTALLVNLAYADAQAQHPTDPSRWEQDAYDSLLRLRTTMAAPSGRAQLSPEFRGRENDPDVSAAEHFFETSLLVDRGVELGLPTAVAAATAGIVHNGYGIYQVIRRTVDSDYESSEPGRFRMRWETAGVLRGMQRQGGEQVSAGEGGFDGERIVITGVYEHRNENRGTESSGSNVESDFSPCDSGSGGGVGAGGSSLDTNSGSDSGMLAGSERGGVSIYDDGGGYDGGGYDGGGYDGGYDSGYDGGVAGGSSLVNSDGSDPSSFDPMLYMFSLSNWGIGASYGPKDWLD